MKKIMVLFTGGTIGSVKIQTPNGKVIMQPSEARERGYEAKDSTSLLLDEYAKRYPTTHFIADLKTETIMETLSENITTKKLAELTEKLKKYNFEDYEGVIITHGTDTLGYTANYLALILANIRVPLVLVSSNYEVTDTRANGVENLKGAIDFIKNESLPGVYVSYTSGGKTKIIHGSRVTQCKQIVDDFDGISLPNPNMIPLGIVEKNGKLRKIDSQLYSSIKNRKFGNNLIDEMTNLKANVLKINPYVGLNYEMFDIKNVGDVILHNLYHSGTACAEENGNHDVNSFIKKCKKYNIPIYFGPIYGKEERDLYSSTNSFSTNEFMMNLSEEMAYIKLLVAYSMYKKEEKSKIDSILFNQISEEYIMPARKILKK